MAAFDSIRLRFPLLSSLLILHLVALLAEPASLFSIPGFSEASLGPDLALTGDAQLDNGGSSCVNLTADRPFSSGNIVYKKHFAMFDADSGQLASFSTDFVFSMTGNGDGLALVIASSEPSEIFGDGQFGLSTDSAKIASKYVAVEYHTRKDGYAVSLNQVGVDIGGFDSSEMRDVSSIGLLLSDGHKLHSWIDYQATSKRLEIRLSESGKERPYNPLLSLELDLSLMWEEREFFVGLSSSGRGSKLSTSVCSWSLRNTNVPPSMHSQPVDPWVHGHDFHKKKKKCAFLTILGGLIFATGCGTLVAFFFLFLWLVLYGRHLEDSPEIPMKNLDFRYERIDVNVDKASDGSKVSV